MSSGTAAGGATAARARPRSTQGDNSSAMVAKALKEGGHVDATDRLFRETVFDRRRGLIGSAARHAAPASAVGGDPRRRPSVPGNRLQWSHWRRLWPVQ